MERENAILRLWTDIARVDYMVEVMANSGSRNAICYVHLVYKENNSQPQLRKEEWQTKTGFFSIANKEQGNMMLQQVAQADVKAALGWAFCKTANIHPETRLPLTDQEKEQMPWLTSQHYGPFQTIANDTVTHEGPQTRSQLQQPAFSIQQPASSHQQSAFTAQRSVLAAQPPALATQRPVLPTQQPALPTQQPALPTQQPALSIQQPALPTQQSALPTQQPMLPTQQPAAQTQPSASATPTPSITQSNCCALFPYQARNTSEASLDQGELVRFIYDRGDGWWLILKSNNMPGFAPSNYLST